MLLPSHETSRWRDGAVALAQGCQPHSCGVSTIAVERRRCRLAVVGGNDGGVCVMDVRDLSKAPLSVVRPTPFSLLPGGTVLDRRRRSQDSLAEGGHEGRVAAAAWLPDDDLLFVTGGDERVKIWDASSPQTCVTGVEMHSQVRAVSVTQAPNAFAAAALSDATVRLIDLRTGRAMNTLQGHSAAVLCVTWGETGTHRLFSGGHDGTIRAWDVRMGARSLYLCDPYAFAENRQPLKRVEPSEEEVERRRNPFRSSKLKGPLKLSDLRFKPYRPMMSPNSFLGTDRAREGHTGQTFGTGAPQLANVGPAPPSPKRRTERAELWNADPTERARHMFEPKLREYENEASLAHRGPILSLNFLPASYINGDRESRLVSCGVDAKLRIWDASTGAPAAQSPSTLEVDSWSKAVPLQVAVLDTPEDICFLPEEERISIRCLRTGDLLCGLAAHTQEVHCATILPGRGELFTGGNDGRLLKWRVESKEPAEDVICLD